MTGEPEAEGAPQTSGNQDGAREQDPFRGLSEPDRREVLDWVGDHLEEVQRTATGQRPVYWILGLALVVGLAAYVGGYLIKTSTTTGFLGLVGDLLYTLGWALWTGVVVVVFLQIIPEAKRRQYKAALDTYEASRREAGAGSDDAAPQHEPGASRSYPSPPSDSAGSK
jgi:hypothetical protein